MSFFIGSCTIAQHPISKYNVLRVPMEISYQELTPAIKKEIDCMSANIYFEANGEPVEGQEAVASVTMNRVKSGLYPKTVCGVVEQKTHSICQFSWRCNASLRNRQTSHKFDRDIYSRIQRIAIRAYYGQLIDNTSGALYFHSTHVSKKAKRSFSNHKMTVQIGRHIFYRT
tara:strand:+ start:285 stop:797 length:513 start_codon:yes stop_codon:yes gene_type:complete